MSLNWVMLDDQDGFVRLPNERLIYSSPPRTSVSLTPPSGYKGTEKLSIQSSAGCIHLTNQRVSNYSCPYLPPFNTRQVVYLPTSRSNDFQSFSSPLLNVRDSHVSAPFFGPNVWTALVQPVAGGGISPSLPAVQLKVTFKEGGAFDFHTNFERIKERLEQAVENTSEGTRGQQNVDLSAVHLEELPAYEAPPNASQNARPIETPEESQSSRASDTGTEPVEPPPCYEEVQSQSVAHELEERLRRAT
ncbi:WW-domain-binding protein [Penicillium concentricum]|uniref:WW-domain-binding protein n=1 Tax=Penicillium concentricum TaxID=293559 RepID=A0A9W9SA94_9EURO|nr:WW-domain-binding protein [Penicillium concentricum]KAJ5374962.1 WW-domain-binding protein [Penicillium concentricum]